MEFFDFNLELLKEYVIKLNPYVRIIPISAKNGEGIEEWAEWLRTEVANWKK
jgi:hydrogenase nickel incorporation protein HypB